MKKILALLFATGILWSCNSGQHSENRAASNSAENTEHHHEESKDGLALNNGAKWKADEATGANVNNLKTVIDNFNTTNDKSLAGYLQTGVELQKGLDKMVSECRMEGPDHDALHKWLLPLLKQVKEFKQSSTTTLAAENLEGISKQVNNYYQYFE